MAAREEKAASRPNSDLDIWTRLSGSRRVRNRLDRSRDLAGIRLAIVDHPQAMTVLRKVVRDRNQRSGVLEHDLHVVRTRTAMFGEQLIADSHDRLTLGRLASLDGKIAFSVGAHGTLVEIGGADAQETVVDDHHLGMDHGVGGLAFVRHLRVNHPPAVADIGFFAEWI